MRFRFGQSQPQVLKFSRIPLSCLVIIIGCSKSCLSWISRRSLTLHMVEYSKLFARQDQQVLTLDGMSHDPSRPQLWPEGGAPTALRCCATSLPQVPTRISPLPNKV
ncbi:hypothetical protein K491DRAFT_282020 [Lophiostoma macrostomum CBS 122681]|uniref:Uncharacterized protein n=1 Tax=Lophiostoma macrostomum CBS 122681 TaxID=1314788 RepID=A0A6A6TQV1_9PLEO|nr:hypothetical protein K491DRAFT_282020 [Lophiostoma macrostomum CBS 122681]